VKEPCFVCGRIIYDEDPAKRRKDQRGVLKLFCMSCYGERLRRRGMLKEISSLVRLISGREK